MYDIESQTNPASDDSTIDDSLMADTAATTEAPENDASEPDAIEPDAIETGAIETDEAEADAAPRPKDDRNWFVVHTYSGYENKVKANLERRIHSMGMQDKIFRVLVPMEDEVEFKDGKRKITP